MWGATEVPGEENQAMCIEVGLSEWTCPVGLHETMKAKPNLQFRLQDAGAARNMKHLLKKTSATENTQERSHVWFRMQGPNPLELTWWYHVPGCQIWSFKVYVSLPGSDLSLALSLPCPIPLFWNVNVSSAIVHWKYVSFLFYRNSQLRLCLPSHKRHWPLNCYG